MFEFSLVKIRVGVSDKDVASKIKGFEGFIEVVYMRSLIVGFG